MLALAIGLLATACSASSAVEGPATATPALGPTREAQRTAGPTATPGQAPAGPAAPAPSPTPTTELISEVLPEQRPPRSEAPPPTPTPVRGGTSLPLPAGTTVVWGGCSSDGECHDYNFYWAPTREVVMQYGEGEHKVQHELCHAHQHWSINGGAALEPSDYDLESWYGIGEGQTFTSSVAGLAWPWTHSAVSGLEDFAWTCAYWYLDPAHLLQLSAERYAWALAHLP